MKRIIALTLIFSVILSCPCYASEETHRLAREAGLEYDTPLEEVLRRQEARNQSKANNSTPNTENGQEKPQRPLKNSNDELRIYGTGQDTVKETDTDGLHIYSNDYADGYNSANYGSKQSTDEFHTVPYDVGANDGYKHGDIDELHINENYRQNVWKPDHKVLRLGIDQFKLPNEL